MMTARASAMSCVKSGSYGAPQYRVDLNITQKSMVALILRAKTLKARLRSGVPYEERSRSAIWKDRKFGQKWPAAPG